MFKTGKYPYTLNDYKSNKKVKQKITERLDILKMTSIQNHQLGIICYKKIMYIFKNLYLIMTMI